MSQLPIDVIAGHTWSCRLPRRGYAVIARLPLVGQTFLQTDPSDVAAAGACENHMRTPGRRAKIRRARRWPAGRAGQRASDTFVRLLGEVPVLGNQRVERVEGDVV